MRLTCPNCEAQYEVADSVIPEEGRDVQCSNCGTTWFQDSVAMMNDAMRKDGKVDETPTDTVIAPDEPKEELPKVAPEPQPSPKGQSTVSEASADILKEEALRDLKQRLAAGSSLERQDDLGLEEAKVDVPKPQMVPPAPMPVPVPVPVPDQGVSRDRNTSRAVADTVGSNRNKLPDIEEINSTLSADSTRRAISSVMDEETPKRSARRTGFRVGFIAAIFVGILALTAYSFAPQISRSTPQAAPFLADYVENADDVRRWFGGWASNTMQSLTQTMNSFTSES